MHEHRTAAKESSSGCGTRSIAKPGTRKLYMSRCGVQDITLNGFVTIVQYSSVAPEEEILLGTFITKRITKRSLGY